MRQFFKFVLATIVGLVAFSFIGILIFAGVIGAAASADGKKEVAANSVLELKLNDGRGHATVMTSDLGYRYVQVNAEYTT